MPELAEVVYHASRWDPAIGQLFRLSHLGRGKRVARDLDASLFAHRFSEAKLLSRETHGKRMLFGFSGGLWLWIHLGMTGSLRYDCPFKAREKHDHLILESKQAALVFNDPRQFGKIGLDIEEATPKWWRALPPQPQSAGFTFDLFRSYCQRKRRSVAKSFLLMQDAFPGLGNWMADEILWRARIRPDRRVEALSPNELEALYKAVRFVAKGALRYIAPDYRDPPKTWLFRHRWKNGGNCPQTGQALVRVTIGGRTTCWSPAWQK